MLVDMVLMFQREPLGSTVGVSNKIFMTENHQCQKVSWILIQVMSEEVLEQYRCCRRLVPETLCHLQLRFGCLTCPHGVYVHAKYRAQCFSEILRINIRPG